jgi:hypothetical protein
MSRRILLLLASFALTGVLWARPDDENYTRLARLSYIEGNVSYQHDTDVDWAAASINMPLEPGDRIYTSPDGRAEIEFDDGSVYRLARNTDVEILSLKEDLIQIRVLVGLSTLIVASGTDFEINTPAAAFNTLQKGSYRFSVDDNGDSDAIVRKGKLEAANNDFSRRIESGEMLHVPIGNGSNPEFARYDRRDDWDEWNDRRNADLNASGGRRYLPDTVYIGVSDLHRNGRWVEVEYYGSAWVPYSVGAYWSPYSVGRWCYRPIFGWTWISYEPWGWLPYHYGRWYRSSAYGWCWIPGAALGFNFWSPGLVAFYSGPGWISWCPLGPGDYYDRNHYHYNRGIYSHQLDQLIRLNTRDRGRLFNRDAPHAFRTVSLDRFQNGSFRGRDRDPDRADVDRPWSRGELVRDNLSIRPTATSYRPAPDRQGARPAGTRALPAVVRSSPAFNAGSQDRYSRISNPKIPQLPTREERMGRTRQESSPVASPKPAGRVNQTPQRERSNTETVTPMRERPLPDSRGAAGGNSEQQNGRRMTTPRGTRGAEAKGDNSNGDKPGSSSGTRSTPAPSGARQNPGQGRSEQAAPAQKQTTPEPAETKPNNEDRQKAQPAQPRSRTKGDAGSETSSFAPAARSNEARTYYYRGSTASPEADSDTRSFSSRASSSPANGVRSEGRSTVMEGSRPSVERENSPRSYSYRAYSTPSYSAPAARQNSDAGSMSFGRSNPSVEHRSESRSYSTPSIGRGSEGSSPSVGRPGSSGGFSGGSGGGAQRAQDRNSSGGGRGRR